MIRQGLPVWIAAGRGWARAGLRLVIAGMLMLMLMLAGAGVAVAADTAQLRALEASLLAQMSQLASDDFGGREPGTEGESKTLRFIAKQWFDMGLVSGTNDPGHAWFAPVTVVAREPAVSTAQFRVKRRLITLSGDDALVLTSGRRSLFEGAPLVFVGRGSTTPPRTELAGRVAVLLDRQVPVASGAAGADGGAQANGVQANDVQANDVQANDVQGSGRQNALLGAGASAVLTVLDGPRNLASVAARRQRRGYALASEALGGDLEGFVTAAAFDRLLAAQGKAATSLAGLEAEADAPGFAPHGLELTASLEATTRETTIHTFNLIGKLPGRHPEAGAVLVLAHWDHFGTCARPPAEHLICNGAIDNASGVAGLTEIARRLAHPPMGAAALDRPQFDRDIYFIATTAEELGLLGAESFAENPPLPLKKVVAAFNLDSIAIAPAGTPLGVVGIGMTPLDAGITQVAREEHRVLVKSKAPNAYIARQDGWALMRHDVPAVLVSSAYGEIGRLEHFFDTDYHRPTDVVKPGIELGGAAEDVLFTVALVRHFADARKVPAGEWRGSKGK